MTALAAPCLSTLEPVALGELLSVAELQTRVDRKYVLTPEQLAALLATIVDRARVLDIDGRRAFDYESVYFDTPRLTAYHLAAHRRPSRFKVRTRSYLDSESCWLEVKRRHGADTTIKHRTDHRFAERDQLNTEDQEFLSQFATVGPLGDLLQPTLTTTYTRSTLLVGDTRLTIDVDVAARRAGRPGPTARLTSTVIVETKCPNGVSDVDRAMWRLGARPQVLSKYGTLLAALQPHLPRNKWHRVLRRHVVVE